MSLTQQGLTQLMSDEGFRATVYDDASGQPIKTGPAGGNPTIGYGRNLVGRGITNTEAIYLLQNDIDQLWANLTRQFPWVQSINPVWQDCVIMVDYNTGDVAEFPKFLAALQAGDAQTAHDELLNSKAANELPARYGRIAAAILNQSW